MKELLLERLNKELDNGMYISVFVVLSNDELGFVLTKKVPYSLLPKTDEEKGQLIVSLHNIDGDYLTEVTGDLTRNLYVCASELTDIEFVGSELTSAYIRRK